jgi:peptidyl-prolyl cis-trans isomerase A (cyclophilin A)
MASRFEHRLQHTPNWQNSGALQRTRRTVQRSIIALVLLSLAQASPGAEASISPGTRVLLDTEAGAIEVEVFPDRAPLSACDFLAYVDAGLYEGAGFYRVVRHDNDRGAPKIEVVQGGLLDETKQRAPIAHETTQMTGLKHVDGALSLARGAVGTGGAGAFFIVIGDQPALDYGAKRNPDGEGFAVFGRVIRGMDIVRRIHRLPADAPTSDAYTQGQLLTHPVRFLKAVRQGPMPAVCKAK